MAAVDVFDSRPTRALVAATVYLTTWLPAPPQKRPVVRRVTRCRELRRRPGSRAGANAGEDAASGSSRSSGSGCTGTGGLGGAAGEGAEPSHTTCAMFAAKNAWSGIDRETDPGTGGDTCFTSAECTNPQICTWNGAQFVCAEPLCSDTPPRSTDDPRPSHASRKFSAPARTFLRRLGRPWQAGPVLPSHA